MNFDKLKVKKASTYRQVEALDDLHLFFSFHFDLALIKGRESGEKDPSYWENDPSCSPSIV